MAVATKGFYEILRVVNYPFMLRVIMLNVIMLGVIMLSVIMPNIAALSFIPR